MAAHCMPCGALTAMLVVTGACQKVRPDLPVGEAERGILDAMHAAAIRIAQRVLLEQQRVHLEVRIYL